MTNGEKIQTILNVDRDCTEVYGENGTMTFTVTQDWWNAEYKEPTTKNDLGVEHHKQNIQTYAHDFGVSEEQAEKELRVTTKNNLEVDCISRTRAIERLKLNFPISQGANNSRDRHRYMQAQADLQAIRELPSVTPQEPKTGEWIENAPEYQNIDPPYICSECGNAHLRKTNYCDQCGARMIELQESEG